VGATQGIGLTRPSAPAHMTCQSGLFKQSCRRLAKGISQLYGLRGVRVQRTRIICATRLCAFYSTPLNRVVVWNL